MAVHYILDGYNVLKKTAPLADIKLEDGRAELIRLIESLSPQGSLNNKVTVVFDGRPGMSPALEAQEVKVVFTYEESADERIKRMVQDSEAPRALIVVTDDREIRYYVKSLGAGVMDSGAFLARIIPRRGKAAAVPDSDKKPINEKLEDQVNQELRALWLKKKRHDKEN